MSLKDIVIHRKRIDQKFLDMAKGKKDLKQIAFRVPPDIATAFKAEVMKQGKEMQDVLLRFVMTFLKTQLNEEDIPS